MASSWGDRTEMLAWPRLWRKQPVETELEKMVPGTDHSRTDRGWDKDSSPAAAQQQPLCNLYSFD